VTNQINIQFLQQKEVISVAEPMSSPQATLYSLQQLHFIALCCIPLQFLVSQSNKW